MSAIPQNRTIAGRPVGQVGFGLMGLTWGSSKPSTEESIAVMKAAVDAGATAFSSATFYDNPGESYTNVKLIRAFFDAYPEYSNKVTVILKGGIKNLGPVKLDEFKPIVKEEIEKSLEILGKDRGIDVFSPARIHAGEKIEDYMEVLKEYKDQGLIKAIGLSECKAETVERASKIANVACLEIEVSLWSYEPTIRNAVEYCGKNNIPVLAYSPLGRGFLTRKYAKPEDIPADSFLAHIPRFQGEAFYKNLELVDKLDEIAKKKGTSTSQLALAWLTSLNDMVIPIPGSSKASRVKDNTAAGNIHLSAEELKTINDTLEAAEIAGGRYPSQAEGALMV